jgi:hypothetical protein
MGALRERNFRLLFIGQTVSSFGNTLVPVALALPGWAIIADAATFFASVAMLALIQFTHLPRAAGQHWLRDLHDGWRDFWTRAWFRDIVLGAAVFNVLYAVYTVLGPVASRRYYGGAAAWATISTVAAIGSVLAGLAATRLRPRHPLTLAVVLSVLVCLPPLAFAGLLPVPVIAAAAALASGGVVVFTSIWQTSVQRHVPEQMLGRASSYDWFCSLIAFPAGLAIAGPLAAAGGLRPVLLAVGVLVIAETAVLLLFPSVRALTDDPPVRPALDAPGDAAALGAAEHPE